MIIYHRKGERRLRLDAIRREQVTQKADREGSRVKSKVREIAATRDTRKESGGCS